LLLKITALPGDGIGPEVTAEALRILEAVTKKFHHELQVTTKPVGGAGLTASNRPLPDDTLQSCLNSDAVLLGAVGGPAFDHYPIDLRPEKGLLKLRQALGCFANLRPAVLFPSLLDSSPLRPEAVQGTDMMIVRELLGGLYFGEPRSVNGTSPDREAVDTMRYTEASIERIARVAFNLARRRSKKVLSVDKANVLACSRLWREVVTNVAKDYPDVELSHNYVDSCAMILVAKPAQYDVILTENMFGDILSDLAGGVVGSLGLLASASIGGKIGLYEPVHGSAPDIEGKGIANPLGAILSVAMMMLHSFQLEKESATIEMVVAEILERGLRTRDLARPGEKTVTTQEMGYAITEQIMGTTNS